MQTGGDAVVIGTLCVLDDKPREPGASDVEVLSELACMAEALLEARLAALLAAGAAEDRRLTVEHLERERRQFKQAERMAVMGSWRYDLGLHVATWSDGIFAIHELPVSGGVPNDEIMSFFPEPDRSAFLAVVMRTLNTGLPFELDADLMTSKGNRRRVRCLGEIEMSKGRPVALMGLLQDITEQYRMEQKLRQTARTDDLTQLSNRAEFNRVLDSRLREADARNTEFAVLLIDLDGFKDVNDALGHAAGDEVLRRVADQLRAEYLSSCVPARLGGDEFAVLVPPTVGRVAIEALVQRLLHSLRIVADGPGQIASVTGTIGVAWSGGEARSRTELLRNADTALYEAKRTCKVPPAPIRGHQIATPPAEQGRQTVSKRGSSALSVLMTRRPIDCRRSRWRSGTVRPIIRP